MGYERKRIDDDPMAGEPSMLGFCLVLLIAVSPFFIAWMAS